MNIRFIFSLNVEEFPINTQCSLISFIHSINLICMTILWTKFAHFVSKLETFGKYTSNVSSPKIHLHWFLQTNKQTKNIQTHISTPYYIPEIRIDIYLNVCALCRLDGYIYIYAVYWHKYQSNLKYQRKFVYIVHFNT